MKANELMIGDWVKIKGHLDYDKVREIARDESMQWYISFACSVTLFRAYEFEPVPLTSEILKKNGWYWGLTSEEEDMVSLFEGAYDEHWVYDEGAGEISLIFPEDTNGGFLKVDDQRFNRVLKFLWNDTLYVHELQHALRLCGLNELAGNFKV